MQIILYPQLKMYKMFNFIPNDIENLKQSFS